MGQRQGLAGQGDRAGTVNGRQHAQQVIAKHFETWHELSSAGQFDGQGDHHTQKSYVRQAFRNYLECGIVAHGFARA